MMAGVLHRFPQRLASFSILLQLLAPAGLAEPATAQERPESRPPNLVVVLVDDLGWTDLGCQGSDLYRTPAVDALAADGVRFTAAYAACTVCSPTRAALQTGLNPARLHVTDWIPGHWSGRKPEWRARQPVAPPPWTQHLEHHHQTLAERLRDAGYRTAHLGKWHLTPRSTELEDVEPYDPEHHGYEVNVAGNQWGAPGSHHWPYRRKNSAGLLQRTRNFPPDDATDDRYLAGMLTDHAVELIERWKDEPFLIHLAHYGVHTPIQGPPELVAEYRAMEREGRRHRNAEYAAMVEAVDRSVGRLRETLDRLGLTDDTLFVFTSDNGGLDRNGNPTDNAPLRAGKGSAYEGGVRVPTVVSWPGTAARGETCAAPVYTCDLTATLLDAADALPGDAALDGVSLRATLQQPDAPLGREAIYWHYPHYHPGGAIPHSAVRTARYRLVEFLAEDRIELYDLEADPSEARDLAAEQPERAKTLRAQLAAWRTEVGAQMPVPNPERR